MNEHLERNKQKYAEEDREYHRQRHEAYIRPGGGLDREFAAAEAFEREMQRLRQRQELHEAIAAPIIRTMWLIAVITLAIWWFA